MKDYRVSAEEAAASFARLAEVLPKYRLADESFYTKNVLPAAWGESVEHEDAQCVYIAGPMRGYPEFNFPAFDSARDKYSDLGYCVHSPADHDRDWGFNVTGLTGNENLDDLGFDLKEAIMWDLTQVAHCDKIVLLKGWLKSSGAQLELNLAQFLGKEVIFD